MVDAATTCVRILVVIGLLVLGYFWNSWDIVFPTEIGIDFSLISYTLGRTYPPGRHFLGLGHRFIHFPTKLNTIDFTNQQTDFTRGAPLRSRTSDGLEVQLEVSFQYKLKSDYNATHSEVELLYRKYGEKYEDVFVLAAIETVTREATKHNASTFFSQRVFVGDRMQERMTQDFNDNYFANIEFFQLRSVSLPTRFEEEIQNTEVQKQDISKAEAERGHQEISGQALVAVAVEDAKSIGLQAEATAATVNLDNEAYVRQFNLTQALQAEGFQQIYAQLNANEDSIIEYLDVRALRDHPSEAAIVSIPMSE